MNGLTGVYLSYFKGNGMVLGHMVISMMQSNDPKGTKVECKTSTPMHLQRHAWLLPLPYTTRVEATGAISP